MTFDVEFDNQPEKFLKKAEKQLTERLIKRIESLRTDPFSQGVKRVLGRKEKTFRVRVGDYKILYVVFLENNCLFISKIDKRPKVY
jgi:mRNA interferase RelE/StbE